MLYKYRYIEHFFYSKKSIKSMSTTFMAFALVLLLCTIGTQSFVLKGRYNNRAISDLQRAQKCNGHSYDLYVPPGIKFF